MGLGVNAVNRQVNYMYPKKGVFDVLSYAHVLLGNQRGRYDASEKLELVSENNKTLIRNILITCNQLMPSKC
jgi:hypothetical protein